MAAYYVTFFWCIFPHYRSCSGRFLPIESPPISSPVPNSDTSQSKNEPPSFKPSPPLKTNSEDKPSSSSYSSKTLKIQKTTYAPGEKIKVDFTAGEDYSADAWIGLIPANVRHGSERINDQHDISYKYLQNRISGSFEFTAPEEPGSYEFRLNNDGAEVSFIPFKIMRRSP